MCELSAPTFHAADSVTASSENRTPYFSWAEIAGSGTAPSTSSSGRIRIPRSTKMQCAAIPDLSASLRIREPDCVAASCSSTSQLLSPVFVRRSFRRGPSSETLFVCSLVGFGALRNGNLRNWYRVRAHAGELSGESGGKNDGDKEVQDTLVEILRMETGKVRVNEFVEEKAKILSDIAETANEEYARIADEAKRTMDAAGSKVLEEIDSKASAFEEELAAARAQIEADEADFEAFEKDVENRRSEGLFFKELYRTVKTKTPEEQSKIKEKAEEISTTVKQTAGSRSRRVFYSGLILVLTLSIVEAASSGNVEWPKLAIYVLLLVALTVQLTYETIVGNKDQRK